MTAARLDGRLVFVDIDTQRDFLEPTGALFVPGSETILRNLWRLNEHANQNGIPVIATACAHTADSAEFAVFPPHCVLGTSGQERIAATSCKSSFVLKQNEAWHAGKANQSHHVTIEKDSYDVFDRPETAGVFADFAQSNPTFVVYGVATDYCVKAAVEGLIQRGYAVAIVVDAIRAIDPVQEAQLLTRFAQAGVLLTLTETVIAHSPVKI